MRQRFSWLLVFIPVSLLLLAPGIAQAKTYTYKISNAKGKVCGSISSSDHVTWKVMGAHGALVGILREYAHPSCSVYHAPSTDGPESAFAYQNLLHPSRQSPSPNAVIGKAVRSHGRRLLKRRIAGRYKTLGSAPVGCPVYSALGAAWLLLWPHPGAPFGSWPVKTVSGGYWGTIWSTTPATYGNPFGGATTTGPGATVWYQSGDTATYYGEVSHEMTELGPVSSLWVLFDSGWQEGPFSISGSSKDLFIAVDLDSGAPVEQAVRGSSGPWRLQTFYEGIWSTQETVARGCPGAWAVGAGALLPLD
jgi:hypothetical protein